MDGEQPRRIGPGTVKRRLPQSGDPRIAKDKIQRQDQHDHDQDARQEGQVEGHGEIQRDSQPKQQNG